MAAWQHVRSDGVFRHIAGIFQIPVEIAQDIVGYIECPYALVSLAKALQSCPLRRTRNFEIDWKKVAHKHSKNLTKSSALSKKIIYNGNEKQKFDNMTMRPSDWTRLPQEYTYLYMIRSKQIHPLTNLDGNIVSKAEIRALYQCEQESKRFELLFKSRPEREGREKPSQASRKKIGMEGKDTRDYAMLSKEIPTSCEKGKIVHRCWIDDKKERDIAIGQYDAFRRFFYDLVLDENFEPAACMGCLAMDTTTAHLLKPDPMRLRLCEKCLKDLAAEYEVELVGKNNAVAIT